MLRFYVCKTADDARADSVTDDVHKGRSQGPRRWFPLHRQPDRPGALLGESVCVSRHRHGTVCTLLFTPVAITISKRCTVPHEILMNLSIIGRVSRAS